MVVKQLADTDGRFYPVVKAGDAVEEDDELGDIQLGFRRKQRANASGTVTHILPRGTDVSEGDVICIITVSIPDTPLLAADTEWYEEAIDG